MCRPFEAITCTGFLNGADVSGETWTCDRPYSWPLPAVATAPYSTLLPSGE